MNRTQFGDFLASPFTAIYSLPHPRLCCVFSCINSNQQKFLRGTQNMIHAIRSLRTQSPSNLVQKASGVRFRQNATISTDPDTKHNMDKTQNPNQQKTGLVYTFLIVISYVKLLDFLVFVHYSVHCQYSIGISHITREYRQYIKYGI